MKMLDCDLNNTNWVKIKIGLSKYQQIMCLVKRTNVLTDKEFQRLFNGFYRIRQRPKEFYEALYGYLEKNKNEIITFEQALLFFYKKLQRLEPSFSSKIVATIRPDYPVWDSEVLTRLGLKTPGYNLDKKTRLGKMVETYEIIVNWYSDFLNTEQASMMIKAFDEGIGISDITDIKKIDLILWQTRL